ncbi:hypothetical protein PNQ29_05255 [Halobacterium salinarum]|uniref:hypothetical protein n=1 Tax=Halobacterium salinarum TaxID=2242 RepID=UPI00255678E5|nr:hypothetical protein [Halobacterium salinarum]MDL0119142.1 hypothetical protein [Halobacterium salinarum]
MSDEDDEIAELRAQSERGSRLEEDDSGAVDLVDDIIDALDAIENGDQRKTIALRDQSAAALLTALMENPERSKQVGDELREALDRDVDDEYDRSEIVRLALRVGLQHASPDVVEDLQAAHQEHASNRF